MTPEQEKAFNKAEKTIERCINRSSEAIDLRFGQALTKIPESIVQCQQLKSINLDDTGIADVSPLAELKGLEGLGLRGTKIASLSAITHSTHLRLLNLRHTPVSDLSPLSGLVNLRSLHLSHTMVSDLDPITPCRELKNLFLQNTLILSVSALEDLTQLSVLDIRDTAVSELHQLNGLLHLAMLDFCRTAVEDLRPLLTASGIWMHAGKIMQIEEQNDVIAGLYFDNCRAALLDPNLRELSRIQRASKRATDTRFYLLGLPKWPEPLFWESHGPETQEHPSAPMRTAFMDDKLVTAAPGTDLADQIEARAKQGWAALLDYLSDFTEQRARIVNQLPSLAKAFNALERALGEEYDAINPVQLGMQAERLIRLSKRAQEMLLEDDADDVLEFTVQLARYLPRFPAWQEYLRDAEDEDAARVQRALADLRALNSGLKSEPSVTEPVHVIHGEILDAVADLPEDQLMALGGRTATIEILLTVAEKARAEAKVAEAEGKLRAFREEVKKQRRTAYAKDAIRAERAALYGSLGVGSDILLNNARIITAIASHFPEEYQYILQVLAYLGW